MWLTAHFHFLLQMYNFRTCFSLSPVQTETTQTIYQIFCSFALLSCRCIFKPVVRQSGIHCFVPQCQHIVSLLVANNYSMHNITTKPFVCGWTTRIFMSVKYSSKCEKWKYTYKNYTFVSLQIQQIAKWRW